MSLRWFGRIEIFGKFGRIERIERILRIEMFGRIERILRINIIGRFGRIEIIERNLRWLERIGRKNREKGREGVVNSVD